MNGWRRDEKHPRCACCSGAFISQGTVETRERENESMQVSNHCKNSSDPALQMRVEKSCTPTMFMNLWTRTAIRSRNVGYRNSK